MAQNVLDYFAGNNFSIANLTAAIQRFPYTPTMTGKLINWTKGPGLTTKVAQLEYGYNSQKLVHSVTWGAPASTVGRVSSRKTMPVNVPHLFRHDTLLADSLSGIRAFGKTSETEVWDDKLAECQQMHRTDMELTWDYMRLKLMTNGIILDADGSTELLDLFDLLGLTQITVYFDLAGTPNIKETLRQAMRDMQTALGSIPMGPVTVLCGDQFFDTLCQLEEITTAWTYGAPQNLVNQQVNEFTYAGTRFLNLTGSFGGQAYIPTNECRIVATSAPVWSYDYAPADTPETVNTIGQEMYNWMTPMEDRRGMNMYFQSNPIFLNTVPRGSIVKGSAAAS